MSGRARIWLILIAAAALRLLRAGLRWDEVSWQYAAYTGPTVRALEQGRVLDALTTWIGLHPPGWALLHAAFELLLPVPAVFLLTSALFSLGAVWVWRDRPLVALLIATSPVQLAYAAEINDYPLVALLVAAAYRWREHTWKLALVGALACWTHPLAAFVVLALALRRPRSLVFLLAAIPLLPGGLALALEPTTYGQPEILLLQSLADYASRFGVLGALVLPAACMGLRKQPVVAAVCLASVVAWLALVAVGVAAPHQFMYLLILTAPLALLASTSPWTRALWVLGIVQGLWFGACDLLRASKLAEAPVTIPAGDVYLLAPPGTNDDDKTKTSAMLWQLSPFQAMPMVQTEPAEDHRHGSPRRVGDRLVYVNDHLREELDSAPRPLTLLVYEGSASLLADVEARYGPPDSPGTWKLSAE
ncbi:MAG TPA: hypothetical protein QGF58_14035 [Myxococcota bacterium]|nr:hypothetical protein [Myxococcota bacterium]